MSEIDTEAIAAKVVAGYEWDGGREEAVNDLSLMLSELERMTRVADETFMAGVRAAGELRDLKAPTRKD